jgi:hypothetical protein
MNWEMISAIGQMLGAIGVIISIVYLAAQIRNQNKESRRAAMNVLTSHWSDLNKTLVENPEMAVLFLRAMKSFDELDGASKLRVGAHLGRFLRFADSLYLGVLDGTLDRRLWRGYERTLADTAAYPGFQAWWATRKHWHTENSARSLTDTFKLRIRRFSTATTNPRQLSALTCALNHRRSATSSTGELVEPIQLFCHSERSRGISGYC